MIINRSRRRSDFKYLDLQFDQFSWSIFNYGVATVSRIDKMIGVFCRISSLLQGSFAKETYHFIDPTNQSHPIDERLSRQT